MKTRIMLAAALSVLATTATLSTTYTGCLSAEKGIIYWLQAGQVPRQPCDYLDSQIQFTSEGPQGPPGPQGPAGPAGPGPRAYRFVGITTARFNGAGGWAAMTRACASQYPGGRMATSEEVRATPNPVAISESAWVLPSPAAWEGNYLLDRTGSILATGHLPGGFDCWSWTFDQVGSGLPSGAVFSPTGAISYANCGDQRPVACVAPEP